MIIHELIVGYWTVISQYWRNSSTPSLHSRLMLHIKSSYSKLKVGKIIRRIAAMSYCSNPHAPKARELDLRWNANIPTFRSAPIKNAKSLPKETVKAIIDERRRSGRGAYFIHLKQLERAGIVRRFFYPTIPPRVEYELTKAGLELLKLTGDITTWFDSHSEALHKSQKTYDKKRVTVLWRL